MLAGRINGYSDSSSLARSTCLPGDHGTICEAGRADSILEKTPALIQRLLMGPDTPA